jgi:hypothetical protein
MKKIILGLIAALFIFSSVGAGVVFAAADPTGPYEGCTISPTNLTRMPTTLGCTADCSYDTGNCGMCCALNSVYTIIDWLFVFLIAVTTLMIIYGAFLFVTSSGNADTTKKARDLILYAAVGLAVAFLAKAIPSLIKVILGVG